MYSPLTIHSDPLCHTFHEVMVTSSVQDEALLFSHQPHLIYKHNRHTTNTRFFFKKCELLI